MRVGDRVKINKKSGFYGQDFGWGIVNETFSGDSVPWYTVIFGDGYKNNYIESDLDVIRTGDLVVINMEINKRLFSEFPSPGMEGKIVAFQKDGQVKVNFGKITRYDFRSREIDLWPAYLDVLTAPPKESIKEEEWTDIYFKLCK